MPDRSDDEAIKRHVAVAEVAVSDALKRTPAADRDGVSGATHVALEKYTRITADPRSVSGGTT